jgi:hypothetical protein
VKKAAKPARKLQARKAAVPPAVATPAPPPQPEGAPPQPTEPTAS